MAERLSALPMHLRPRALRDRAGALRRLWTSLFVAAAAMGITAWMVIADYASTLTYLLAGGILFAAMVSNRRARRALFLPPPDALGATRQARVQEALTRAGRRPTLQELATHLNWEAAAVAEALYGLVMAGTVEEDLDDETGEAVYGLAGSPARLLEGGASADTELSKAIEAAAAAAPRATAAPQAVGTPATAAAPAEAAAPATRTAR